MGDYTCNVFFCKRIIFVLGKSGGGGADGRRTRGGEENRLKNSLCEFFSMAGNLKRCVKRLLEIICRLDLI